MPLIESSKNGSEIGNNEVPAEKITLIQWKDERVSFGRVRGDITSGFACEVDIDSYNYEGVESRKVFMVSGGRIFKTFINNEVFVSSKDGEGSFPEDVKDLKGLGTDGKQESMLIPGRQEIIPLNRVTGDIDKIIVGEETAEELYKQGFNNLGKFVDMGGRYLVTEKGSEVLIRPEGDEVSFPPGY